MSGPRPLALVTGGSRRLGAAIATRLAESGYDLALHGHAAVEPEPALVAAIAQAGVAWQPIVADLADAAALVGIVPAVERLFGRTPDLLVNSASRFEEDRPETVERDALLGHYAVNCAAPVLLARDVAARARTGAAIVNILDQRIAAPHGDQFAYTLAKLALAGATEILAREFAPAVRVCGVAPGLVLPTPDYADDGLTRAARLMPLERLAGAGEIADAVLYLARSPSITGQILYVDGGAHLRSYPRDFLYLD